MGPAEPSAPAGIHPSHLTLNLGHQWSCSRCNAHHSVRTRVNVPLSKECKGDGKKGGQRPSPVPRFSSPQGFAALFAGRAVPPSDALIPEFQRPPNLDVLRPKTSVPPLFMAVYGSSFSAQAWPRSAYCWPPRSRQAKCKAKAKPKVKSGAGLGRRCFVGLPHKPSTSRKTPITTKPGLKGPWSKG